MKDSPVSIVANNNRVVMEKSSRIKYIVYDDNNKNNK